MNKGGARYGSQAQLYKQASLPMPFLRALGPNCMKYLREVMESGLTSDMVQRFEHAFAAELGIAHLLHQVVLQLLRCWQRLSVLSRGMRLLLAR